MTLITETRFLWITRFEILRRGICIVPNYDEINERHELITEPFAEKIKAALEELITEHYRSLHGLVAVKIGKDDATQHKDRSPG